MFSVAPVEYLYWCCVVAAYFSLRVYMQNRTAQRAERVQKPINVKNYSTYAQHYLTASVVYFSLHSTKSKV